MVKGVTRRVVVVQGSAAALFDQAIFLIRDRAVEKGQITEEALLKEARQICRENGPGAVSRKNILWAGSGAAFTGLLWLLSQLLR